MDANRLMHIVIFELTIMDFDDLNPEKGKN